MSSIDQAYKALATEIIETGEIHENRTGVNTRRIWGAMIKHDMATDGFPLLTQKKMAVKSAFVEMLGFVRGETDVDWYSSRGCKIWEADHARWHGKDLERDKKRLAEIKAARAADNVKIVAGQDYLPRQHTTQMAREADLLTEAIEARENNPLTLGQIYGAMFRSCGDSDAPRHDQLKDIVEALKARSNSRRLIMSAWMPHRFHLMCLPPCHVMYHFSLRGEFVDVAMTQRSQQSALAA
jgi:thymidylate synthase